LQSRAQLNDKGWWTRDLFHYSWVTIPGSSGSLDRNYRRFFTQPEIGHTLGDRWMAGIVGQFEYISDRYEVPQDTSASGGYRKTFYGAGPLLRYYLPLSNRIYFMPEFFLFYSREKYTNLSYNLGALTEYSYGHNTFGGGTYPSIVCFLNRDLAFSITVISATYYTNRESKSLTISLNPQQWLLGVEYYFGRKKQES